VVLTDFGIAAIEDATALTATGQVVGSPAYRVEDPKVSQALSTSPVERRIRPATMEEIRASVRTAVS